MKLHLAPMQGYADSVYLRHHINIYGGNEDLYTPFIRIEKGEPRRQDMSRLKKAIADGLDITPQIIFSSATDFALLSRALKILGCHRIDLNLGCPYPMQTGKGRGSAMIANVNEMEKIAALISTDREVTYSVKMRLGMSSADEWERLLPVLNQVELDHVAVHPRIATQMYDGTIDIARFAGILRASANPVVYNGDLRTKDDIRQIAESFPEIAGVMIGRGFLARPSLGVEWSQEEEWNRSRRMSHIVQFHENVFREYSDTLCGPVQILQKVKPFWDYLEPEIGHKLFKSIRKTTTIAKYRELVGEIAKSY